MRIKRCDIKAFGQFRERSFNDLNHPFLVIRGENEAGKTTFFQFLRSMLYGFYPDSNGSAGEYKYAPKDGAVVEGELTVALTDASDLVVSRKLDKIPSGVMLNGSRDEIGNRVLPVLEHVSRPVFESVYTLGLYDMIEFSGEAWEKIQDRLLGSLNAGQVRSTRDVIRALEEEAASIWGSDLHRNSLLRQLETQQSDLKKQVLSARSKDETLRRLTREIAACEAREKALENEQIHLKADRRRVKRLLPVHRLVERIAELKEQGGDVEPFQHIPESPLVIIDTLSEQIQKDRDNLEYAKRDIRFAQQEIQKFSKSLLVKPLTKEVLQAIRELPEIELRHRVYACQEAMGNLREVQMYAKMLSVRVSVSKPLYPWILIVLLAILMIAGGFVFSSLGNLEWLWMSGMILMLFGTLQALEVSRHNRNIGYDEAEEWPEVADFEMEADIQRQTIAEMLEKIPLSEVRLENPDLELVSDLDAMKATLDDYDQQVRQYVDLEKEFAMRNRSTLKKIKELKEPLETLGDGDLKRGARVLDERRKAIRQALQYEETLRQDYPDWKAMKEEIDEILEHEDEIVFSDEDIVRMESRLEQIDAELKEVVEERVEKSKDREQLQNHRPIDMIDSEIALITRRRQDLEERRDRLQLLANLLKRADQQFKMKHQPEVIRLAGEYLSHVTNGRYSRLGMNEENGQLMVYEGDSSRTYPVAAPLSQGTCDQIYLAIRLAIIDYLDDGRERIPVFLDEVFVNWDASRRKNVYGIMRKMAEKRQVFLFTCHDWQAEEAIRELGAHDISLARN